MHRFHHWRVRIQDANSAREVAGVMEDYLRTIPGATLEVLPCREALQTADISQAAMALLQCEMRFQGPPEVAALLHEVAHTFAAASVRLASLAR